MIGFIREAEYITAASFCGLDLIYYDDYYSVQGLSFKLDIFIKEYQKHEQVTFFNRQQDYLNSTKKYSSVESNGI